MKKAAVTVLDARSSHSGNTGAGLYDATAMPNDLHSVHTKLDAIAAECFSLEKEASDEEILEVLFDAFITLTSQRVDSAS